MGENSIITLNRSSIFIKSYSENKKEVKILIYSNLKIKQNIIIYLNLFQIFSITGSNSSIQLLNVLLNSTSYFFMRDEENFQNNNISLINSRLYFYNPSELDAIFFKSKTLILLLENVNIFIFREENQLMGTFLKCLSQNLNFTIRKVSLNYYLFKTLFHLSNLKYSDVIFEGLQIPARFTGCFLFVQKTNNEKGRNFSNKFVIVKGVFRLLNNEENFIFLQTPLSLIIKKSEFKISKTFLRSLIYSELSDPSQFYFMSSLTFSFVELYNPETETDEVIADYKIFKNRDDLQSLVFSSLFTDILIANCFIRLDLQMKTGLIHGIELANLTIFDSKITNNQFLAKNSNFILFSNFRTSQAFINFIHSLLSSNKAVYGGLLSFNINKKENKFFINISESIIKASRAGLKGGLFYLNCSICTPKIMDNVENQIVFNLEGI